MARDVWPHGAVQFNESVKEAQHVPDSEWRGTIPDAVWREFGYGDWEVFFRMSNVMLNTPGGAA